jgi:hypothetical protein
MMVFFVDSSTNMNDERVFLVLDESCIEPLLPNYIWSDESPAKF